ncbi:MAG: hypothetical protein VKL42_00625, partial [Snowella sp.]|nr:hypothetical protein [Snowella sp.]
LAEESSHSPSNNITENAPASVQNSVHQSGNNLVSNQILNENKNSLFIRDSSGEMNDEMTWLKPYAEQLEQYRQRGSSSSNYSRGDLG